MTFGQGPQGRARAITALASSVIFAGLVTRACADPARDSNGAGGSGGEITTSNGTAGQSNSQGGGSSGTSASAGASAGAEDIAGGASSVGGAGGCSSHCNSACETCERDVCPTMTPFNAQPWYSYAYGMEGTAALGPKKGTPRAELVRQVLECIYDSKCTLVFNNNPPLTSQISLRECFCKNAPAGTEPSTYPDVCKHEATLQRGPCLDQMLAASETDTVDNMLSKLTNLSTPLGRAFYLLQHCDARVCGSTCLPTETGL
jgi:hypothetical protein